MNHRNHKHSFQFSVLVCSIHKLVPATLSLTRLSITRPDPGTGHSCLVKLKQCNTSESQWQICNLCQCGCWMTQEENRRRAFRHVEYLDTNKNKSAYQENSRLSTQTKHCADSSCSQLPLLAGKGHHHLLGLLRDCLQGRILTPLHTYAALSCGEKPESGDRRIVSSMYFTRWQSGWMDLQSTV